MAATTRIAGEILSDIVEAEAAAAGSYATPSGTLAVTASVLFGHMHVLPIVTDYLDAYSTMAARTLFVDRQVNIVEEGIDVAVRIGHLSDSGLTAARVGSVRRVVCGSPAYFERHGVPQSPQDLRDHRVAMSTGAWASTEWRFAQDQRVTVHPALMSNTNEAGIAAALAGWGLTRVLHYQIGSALLGGRLQVVLADYEEEPLPIHVVYPRAAGAGQGEDLRRPGRGAAAGQPPAQLSGRRVDARRRSGSVRPSRGHRNQRDTIYSAGDNNAFHTTPINACKLNTDDVSMRRRGPRRPRERRHR